MAHPKDRHYWIQLRTVLTGGQWDANFPAKAPNAAPLSWSELLRKFNKHCPGHTDVAELASQTQALAILLSSTPRGTNLDCDGNRFDHSDPLALGQECMLPEERVGEASQGYTALTTSTGSNTEVRLYYIYCNSLAHRIGSPSSSQSRTMRMR